MSEMLAPGEQVQQFDASGGSASERTEGYGVQPS